MTSSKICVGGDRPGIRPPGFSQGIRIYQFNTPTSRTVKLTTTNWPTLQLSNCRMFILWKPSGHTFRFFWFNVESWWFNIFPTLVVRLQVKRALSSNKMSSPQARILISSLWGRGEEVKFWEWTGGDSGVSWGIFAGFDFWHDHTIWHKKYW